MLRTPCTATRFAEFKSIAREAEAGLELFSRWTPSEGIEFKAFYGRADGGGFAIAEVDLA